MVDKQGTKKRRANNTFLSKEPGPPESKNKVTLQYTTECARVETYRLRERLQGKTKFEEVLNDIVVSDPYVFTGF